MFKPIILFIFMTALFFVSAVEAKKVPPWEKDFSEWSYEDCDAFFGKDSPWKSQRVASLKQGVVLVNAFWQTRLSILGKVKKEQIDKKLSEEEVRELSYESVAEAGLSDSLIVVWVVPLIKSHRGFNLTKTFWDDLQDRVFVKLNNNTFIRPVFFDPFENQQARIAFLKQEVLSDPPGKVQLVITLEGQELNMDFDCKKMRYNGEFMFY